MEINPYKMAIKQVEIVAKEMGLDPNSVEALKRIEMH